MARTITAATLAAAQSQAAEVLHLVSLAFSGGTLRLTTGPHDVSWDSQTWYAAGGAMSFEAVSETPDLSGQRVKLTLDGVNTQAISALLAQDSIGRLGHLYRAYLSSGGQIIADPILLFLGYMNSAWEVMEDPDGRWAKVETELTSPLAVLEQRRGIVADLNSHQQFFATDTFFSHIATKSDGDFGWGLFVAGPEF